MLLEYKENYIPHVDEMRLGRNNERIVRWMCNVRPKEGNFMKQTGLD